MTAESFDRIERLVHQLSEVVAVNPGTWRDVDLTIGQIKALYRLHARQPLTLTELAAELQMSLTSASALIERLVRVGMVDRRAAARDRRQIRLALTPAGAALLARLAEKSSANLRLAIARMSPSGLVALEAALAELVRVTDELSACGAEDTDAPD